MKSFKFRFMSIAIIAVSALFLVGCRNGADGTQEAAGDQVTIEVFSMKVEMRDVLAELIADFEYQNPDINVEFTSMTDGVFVLRTRMAANEAPDVVHAFPIQMDFREWAADGRFVDLTGKDFMGNLTPGAAEIYAVNGGLYSLPLNTNATGFYFNKTRFEELGLSVPGTWDEFLALVDAINDAGEVPFVTALSTPDAWTLSMFHQMAWVRATGSFHAAQDVFLNSGEITVDNPYVQQVAEKLSIVSGNTQPTAIGASYPSSVASFVAGEGLMMPQGTWALPIIRELQPDFEVSMFPFPGEEPGDYMSIGSADMAFSVSADSSPEVQEASLRFMEFISTTENFQRFFDVDGQPTSIIGVETEGRFEEFAPVAELAFTEQLVPWLHAYWPSEEDFNTLAVEFVINQDIQAFVDDLNRFFGPIR